MRTLKQAFTFLLLLSMYQSSFADADADRKNKCRNGKRYKQTAKVKGGTSNCGNFTVGTAWHCNNGFSTVSSVANWKGNSSCSCGNTKMAAEAAALSNQNTLYTMCGVYDFSCGWPNKWKAGSSSLYQSFTTPSPMRFPPAGTEEYVSEANMRAATDSWDYEANSVTLYAMSGKLKKYTADMMNDYATFVLNITRITGPAGAEVSTSLFQCRITIYGNELIVEDPTGTFNTDDFTKTTVGAGGVLCEMSSRDKTIPLSADIVEDDELNINFFVDCGNYEMGAAGKALVSEELMTSVNEKAEASQTLAFKVLNNPVMTDDIVFVASVKSQPGNNYNFFLRDITGKIVKEWSAPLTNEETKYTFTTEGLENGVYLLSVKYGTEEYGRKVIVDKNH